MRKLILTMILGAAGAVQAGEVKRVKFSEGLEFYSPSKGALCMVTNGETYCEGGLDVLRITIDGVTFELNEKFGIIKLHNEEF